jgi:transposase
MTEGAMFAVLQFSEPQRHAFLERVRGAVAPADYRVIEGMSQAVPQLLTLLEQKDMSIGRLRQMLFGPQTEKTGAVCPPPAAPADATAEEPSSKPRPPGHGRRAAQTYSGARRVRVPHAGLKGGEVCPGCRKGRLRPWRVPGLLLRIVAAPPVSATLFELEKLRCDLCGQVQTATPPAEAGTEKFDASVGAMVALLRYGSGLPFYRLAQLQQSLGVPLPASTQWELVRPLAEQAAPVLDQLINLAAQSPLLHNDDTTMRVASLRREPAPEAEDPIAAERTGTFTSGIVARADDHPLALFFTGRQHAGENLDEVLRRRSDQLPPPLQMCDALSRNACQEHPTLLGNCLAHGRRAFVEVAPNFPAACRHVLETLREVYHVDAQAQAEGLCPEARLALHQAHSQPVMETLHAWLQEQIEARQVEPNSGLGQAIGYLLRHWEPLTLFLREPGAPLDNNVCERALKMAILHRKNSLAYKTANGARVGDLFMSLIHTCRLNAVNPFDYLVSLARNAAVVARQPQDWLPWNYPNRAALTDTS